MTNVLYAINHIIDANISSIKEYKALNYKNRMNNMGEALENFITDALCNSFGDDEQIKLKKKSECFSYLGNQNNPPDLIIKYGDAFEIKKIEGNEGSLALNSSFPKDKLYRNSTMITNACRDCEDDWIQKDICYVIGCIDKQEFFKSLWFVYGDCYCANPEIYMRIKDKITDGIQSLGIETSETNEIAKVKKVDPLGITDLRVRGMWSIYHPSKVFDYVTQQSNKPYIKAIMLTEKFNSFDEIIKTKIQEKANVSTINIKNPNNPAQLQQAVLIEYEFLL
jgi:hypothetical protein